ARGQRRLPSAADGQAWRFGKQAGEVATVGVGVAWEPARCQPAPGRARHQGAVAGTVFDQRGRQRGGLADIAGAVVSDRPYLWQIGQETPYCSIFIGNTFRPRGCHAAGGTLHWTPRAQSGACFFSSFAVSRSPMTAALPDAALDQLFRSARTYNAFGGEISDQTLHQLYDLVKWGPTSANMSPARFVFVKSQAAKARLEPALSEGNHDKTMSAPVTVIVGFDEDFHEKLPYLFPHTDARAWFEGPRDGRREAALRNGSLQGAYLILAARALG